MSSGSWNTSFSNSFWKKDSCVWNIPRSDSRSIWSVLLFKFLGQLFRDIGFARFMNCFVWWNASWQGFQIEEMFFPMSFFRLIGFIDYAICSCLLCAYWRSNILCRVFSTRIPLLAFSEFTFCLWSTLRKNFRFWFKNSDDIRYLISTTTSEM